jgi:hypothetical protein
MNKRDLSHRRLPTLTTRGIRPSSTSVTNREPPKKSELIWHLVPGGGGFTFVPSVIRLHFNSK